MGAALHGAAWLLSVALAISLLIRAPRYGAAFVVKRAIAAIVIGVVVVLVVALVLRGLSVQPSHGFSTALFQLLFTVVVVAMLNGANVTFHGMVDTVIGFHRRYNAGNLHRFPISFMIRNENQLKMFGTAMWCFGSTLMLYGVWFDTHI